MFNRSKVCNGVLLALGGAVIATSTPTLAQDVQRVEITGSSIKRIAAEGALPVITLNRAEIEQSGATTVRELLQQLPVMQGFTTTSDSVNGGAGGETTASLRNLGSEYTLVLLNGRRVAPFNTGSTVNLEQIPIAAIERVEILADGASALYGADAIAGVVNFITKQDTTEGIIQARLTRPQRSGGAEQDVSISKGFGSLVDDGFNVFVGASFSKQDQLKARDREFASTGLFPFTSGGVNYWFAQSSINSTPPNVAAYDGNDALLRLYNPILVDTGACGTNPATFRQGVQCRFDYASTVEIQPESERTNIFASASAMLTENVRVFGEIGLSEVSLTGRFAPPAQPLLTVPGEVVFDRYVAPYAPDAAYGVYYLRLADAGLRANQFDTSGQHFVAGVDGTFAGFDTALTLTHSKNTIDTKYAGGYVSRKKMTELIESGTWDPFAQGTPESAAAIEPAVLSGLQSRSKSALTVLSLSGSGKAFDAPGGQAYLGAGVEYTRQSYSDEPSAMAQGQNAINPDFDDFPVGSSQGALPFDSSRTSKAAFAELAVPLTRTLEVTGSLRYDNYSAVKNSSAYDATGNPIDDQTQGNSASRTTYKLSGRWQPSQQFLVRGSYGTGFRAPTLADITNPLVEFGVISVQRDCPVTDPSDPLFVGCRSVPYQYQRYNGGNPFTGDAGLKPETSEQWTLGFRVEPIANLSFGLDYWSVKIDDALTVVPEDTAFDNFELYRDLFTITPESGTGRPILTFNTVPINSAVLKSSGIDWDLLHRANVGFGILTTRWQGTYLTESYFDLGFGGGKESSIGKLGSDDQVAFRVLSRLSASLRTGDFTNTLVWSYRPGYRDQSYTAGDGTVFLANPDGTRGAATDFEGLDVPSYSIFDWQGRYQVNQRFEVVAGIKNLFDKQPPRSLKTVGGNQIGYDPRYADGLGRTFYIEASFGF